MAERARGYGGEGAQEWRRGRAAMAERGRTAMAERARGYGGEGAWLWRIQGVVACAHV